MRLQGLRLMQIGRPRGIFKMHPRQGRDHSLFQLDANYLTDRAERPNTLSKLPILISVGDSPAARRDLDHMVDSAIWSAIERRALGGYRA